jgi:hypothetical protein
VAAVGSARADREVVAHQLAAAVGENRRTGIILATTGSCCESHLTRRLYRGHAAEDRGVTLSGGIADCWVAETIVEKAASEGPVGEKSVFRDPMWALETVEGLEHGQLRPEPVVIVTRIAT